jgi:bacterioferritin
MKLVTFVTMVSVLAFLGCASESPTDGGLAKLQKIHRGELSAIATYDKAMEKAGAPLRTELGRIRDDHRDASDRLAARIKARGGTADTTAGVWGDWTSLLSQAAASINDASILKVLKTGERHGIEEYDEGLKIENLDAESKSLLQTLLERQRTHVPTLEGLEKKE